MSAFRDADDLRTVLHAFLDRFLASADGGAAAAHAAHLDEPPVLEVRTWEPELVLHVDVAARAVADGPAPAAAAVLEVRADDLHDLLLDRFGPVEISRLNEEERLRLVGSPPALLASLLLAGELQAHYPATLAELGRDDLLGTPQPEVRVIWESATPPPPVFGVRRPWQRAKGATV